MYSLPIRYPSGNSPCSGQRKEWWGNFTKTTREAAYGPGLNFSQTDWILHRYNELAKYNAFYDGTFVHFETEQDATVFLLRWS